MKTVYIIGSFKFYKDMLNIQKRLTSEGVRCSIPQPSKYRDPNDPSKFLPSIHEQSKEILVEDAFESTVHCFRNIDENDVIYVLNKEGYIGKSTVLDIGYAFAKKKLIYALETVDDLAVQSLIKVVSPDRLVEIAREG